jgi:hypothetical protein
VPDLITAVVPVGPVPLEWWDQYARGIQPDLYSCQLVFAKLPDLVARCRELEAECARLREMHAHRCERVAAQSELLSRRAERKPAGAGLAAEFLKPDLGGEG